MAIDDLTDLLGKRLLVGITCIDSHDVIVDQVQLAKIHGCVGPAFFALTDALAAVTSRRGQQPGEQSPPGSGQPGSPVGQAGRVVKPSLRACAWIRRISATISSSATAMS